jgi:6,7-dimethyl-8-ribityllumazine synthase
MKTAKPASPILTVSANVLIVEARFYEDLLDELGAGARAALDAAGASYETVAVPGALELPGAIAIAVKTGRYDGYVALGCVIRGETSHYDIVANQSARALMDLTIDGLAVGNGILTVDTEDQAWARARRDGHDKGGVAARAALAMIALRQTFASKAKVHG